MHPFMYFFWIIVLMIPLHVPATDHETLPTVISSEDQQETAYECGGYLRTGFIQTHVRTVETTVAHAISANLGCHYHLNSHIKAHLGLYGTLDIGLNSQTDDNIHNDFFNTKKDSYLIVGEAALTLSYKKFEAHLGRQLFDSPHFDADDIRMISNLFEAYVVDYQINDQLTVGTGFIREASGWENGANMSHFVSIGEALGGKNAGAWVGWFHSEASLIHADAWIYIVPNHLVMTYAEVNINQAIQDDISYHLGFQYDWGESMGDESLGKINAHTLGVMGDVTVKGLTFTAAYNKNFGQSGALTSIGGGPFFVSFDDQSLDMVTGSHAEGYMLSLDYSILDDTLNFGVMMGEFRAINKRDYYTQEINYFINYNWKDMLTVELMYAAMDNKNSSADMNQLRATLTYYY